MSHLDEGTLNALLDGELTDHEVRAIQAHLGGCASCGTRLKSVKEMLTESDRLVGGLQFPGTPRRPAALDPEPEIPDPEPAAAPEAPPPLPPPRPRPPPSHRQLDPVYDEAPPVLLVPDNSQWDDRRRRLLTGMRWAALLLVAVGAGYLANEVRRTGNAPVPASTREALSDEPSEPVVSAEETTARPETAAAASRPVRDSAAPASEPARDRARPAAPAPEPRADRSAAPAPVEAPPAGAAEPQGGEPEVADELEPAADEPLTPGVREEAAKALAELDRERQIERAAAATAALDSASALRRDAARRNAAGRPAAVAPAPPAPRTLEQRSQIYLRIGLDEAARQLGRPVHVIEGMTPEFMGLAQGSASAGADTSRPVVRVVYRDSQGRLILLDQQRIRPGQSWGSDANRWVQGEIGLLLHGEAGPEVLRNLRPRVR